MKIPFKSLRFSNAPPDVGRCRRTERASRERNVVLALYHPANRGLRAADGHAGRPPGHLSGRNLQAIPYGNFANRSWCSMRRRPADRELDPRRPGCQGGCQGRVHDGPDRQHRTSAKSSPTSRRSPSISATRSTSRRSARLHRERRLPSSRLRTCSSPDGLPTRRRRPPDGQGGRWAFGALGVNDDEPGREVEAGDPRSGKTAGIGVFRAQREFRAPVLHRRHFHGCGVRPIRKPRVRRRRRGGSSTTTGP